MSSELALRSLEVAIGEIGAEENPRGSNWGKPGDPVPRYLRAVGLNFPASWCMAFVISCIDTARADEFIHLPIFRSGKVLDVWRKSPKPTRIFLTSNLGFTSISNINPPQPGDVMIIDHGHELGHTGIVERYDPQTNEAHTIEGNTNDTGSREGFAVMRKTRKVEAPIIGFLRY